MFLFIGVELFHTTGIYDQSAFWTYYELCTVIMLVWCYPLVYILKSERVSLTAFLEITATFTIISYLLRTLAHIGMVITGSYFMSGIVFEYGEPGIRNGFYRIQQPCLSSIFIPIAIYLYFSVCGKIKKIWYLFGVAAAIIFTFFINQSRSILVYQIFITISMFLFKDRPAKKKAIFWYMVIMCIIAISQSEIMNGIFQFFSTFSPDSEYGKSTTIRIDTIVYYMELLKENIVTGIGALNIGTSGALSILRGKSGTAYLDDIGLLATVVRYGVLGFMLHIIVFGNAVYTIIKFPHTENSSRLKKEKLLLVHLLLSVLLWGINIDCYFHTVSLGMPIFIAVFEYFKFLYVHDGYLYVKHV